MLIPKIIESGDVTSVEASDCLIYHASDGTFVLFAGRVGRPQCEASYGYDDNEEYPPEVHDPLAKAPPRLRRLAFGFAGGSNASFPATRLRYVAGRCFEIGELQIQLC